MNEGTLHTWQGIEAILHRLTDEQSEPDPWVSFFVTRAIQSVGRGEPNLRALEMAAVPPADRHAHEVDLAATSALTRADLRAAFETVPVPGGHPI